MAKTKKKVHIGGLQLPMFDTPSTWELPTEFPDLRRRGRYLGFDVESRDPNLKPKGPGFIRRDADAVGVSLATEDGFKIYLPFGHETGPNMDRNQVLTYVRDMVSSPDQIKVGANVMYELEALDSVGIKVAGPLHDIQIAEALLDEDKPEGFSLEALSLDYLGYGKSEELLEEAADNWGLDKKKDLWRLSPRYCGEYAEDDSLNPVKIIQMQLPKLHREGLDDVWNLECKLVPILWKMRKHGVAVDVDRAVSLTQEVMVVENQLLAQIRQEADFQLDPWSSKSLYECFSRLGLTHLVARTPPSKTYPDGQPSFKNEWFKEIAKHYPFCDKILEFRNTTKMRRDFLGAVIIEQNVDGRLHPQWHPLRADDEDRENGTRTGRVASSKPNLTQIPSRHPIWGRRIRSLFKADEGGRWCKNDWSQQEPRLGVHFGYLKGYKGAAEARQRYLDDPSTDYHQMTADLIEERTGRSLDPDPKTARRLAKDINLGSAYGMGVSKLAAKLGVEMSVAQGILESYHSGVPFVKKLEERCIEVVQAQGYIRTILGRKRRFNLWEASDWKKRSFPVRLREEAEAMWGNVVRAYAHKAYNAMIQGTAADQVKTAIVLLDEEGLTPQIQVYDELNQTVYSDDAVHRIREVMENCLPQLTVPHLADADLGPSWGEVKAWQTNHVYERRVS